ncbi:MAG: DUF5678 domain-containing protein [Nitrospiraceae bacterium]
MNMPFTITETFNQMSAFSPPSRPITRNVTTNVSSLAAGEGQLITALVYNSEHIALEDFMKLPITGQDTWCDVGRGAYTEAMATRLNRGAFYSFFNILGQGTDSPLKAAQTSHEIVSYTQAIKQALETEQIFAARNILAAIPTHLARDPGLSSFSRVLALPVVHVTTKRDTDRSQEFNWLRTEGHKYRGQWVAIDGDRLLATATSLRSLRGQLKSKYPDQSPLIHRIV